MNQLFAKRWAFPAPSIGLNFLAHLIECLLQVGCPWHSSVANVFSSCSPRLNKHETCVLVPTKHGICLSKRFKSHHGNHGGKHVYLNLVYCRAQYICFNFLRYFIKRILCDLHAHVTILSLVFNWKYLKPSNSIPHP